MNQQNNAPDDSDEDLDDDLYEEICEISEEGNVLMDNNNYQGGLEKFQKALILLPEPQTKWEAYTWLKASTGDAYFFLKDYANAKEEFFDAMNGPDGYFNPFVLMRLGECFHETGDDRAQDFLMKAFLLEGKELFDTEDSKYFALIKSLTEKSFK
jgi:tetratricopeptide (TPR) repeat protein